MNLQKLYINQKRSSVLICPHCGKSKAVDGSKLVNRGGQIKLAVCTCGSKFQIFFESRRGQRRGSNRRGQFAKLPRGDVWHSMLLNSVSPFGLGFSSATADQLQAGEEARVRFFLDERRQHPMEADVQIVWAENGCVGCRFKERIQDERFRAFYLML